MIVYFRLYFPKQPPRGVLSKRRSQNMQQIYRRTTMPKCGFNKVANQIYWNHTSAGCSPVNIAACFQNPSFLGTPLVAASVVCYFFFPNQKKVHSSRKTTARTVSCLLLLKAIIRQSFGSTSSSRRCYIKKLLSKILENSQKTPVLEYLF